MPFSWKSCVVHKVEGAAASFSAPVSEISEVWVSVPPEHTLAHTPAPVKVIVGNFICVIQKHTEEYSDTSNALT